MQSQGPTELSASGEIVQSSKVVRGSNVRARSTGGPDNPGNPQGISRIGTVMFVTPIRHQDMLLREKPSASRGPPPLPSGVELKVAAKPGGSSGAALCRYGSD